MSHRNPITRRTLMQGAAATAALGPARRWRRATGPTIRCA